MKDALFGSDYAQQYDMLYSDKDYEAECDILERVFDRHGIGPASTIVDLGCGTGNHAIPLARRGYDVTGVDISSAMLEIAKRKAESQNAHVKWMVGDVRDFDLGTNRFDVGLLMFAVLGYLLRTDHILAALRNLRRQLRPNGLVAFDVWYGPAVLAIGPVDRVKVVSDREIRTIRTVHPQLDVRHHTCDVHYHLWQLNGDRVATEAEEVHTMRFFFPMELEHLLTDAGFQLTTLTSFPAIDHQADEGTWNVLGVAKAV